ncbi:MAG: Gfo/Idh/MocA family oxidoreductase [Sphaerochaetaceae bacterium]
MLKIGIFGAGFIGSQHAASYKEIKDAQLVAIVDNNREAGEKLAKEFGVAYYNSAEELFESEKVDIVDICLPTFLHEQYVTMAFEKGAHVLCEKPFALSYESAKKMVEAAEKAQKTLMVGQVIRFWPEYVVAKEVVDKGELGTIKMVTMSRMAQHPDWSTWHRDPQKSGGGLFDLHVHDIDYLCYLFGEVDQIYAIGEKDKNGCWNHVLTSLTFKSGERAAAEGAFEMTDNYPFTMTMRLVGHKATFEYNFIAGFNLENVGGAQRSAVLYRNGKDPELLKIDETDAYFLELKYFVEQIAKGESVEKALPRHSLYVMSVMEAIQTSLEQKRVVTL